MNKFGFKCNKIIIIESLPEAEKQIRNGKLMSSGDYYIEELFPYCNKISGKKIDFEMRSIDSENELLSCLDEICKNVIEKDETPLIHFEIHGREQQDGITLKCISSDQI